MADDEVVDVPPPSAATSGAPAAHAAPRRSRWRLPLIVIGVVVGVALVAGAGLVLGRLTAPGPDIIVAPGPVVEESPGVEQLPVGASQPAPQPSAAPTSALATSSSAPAVRPGITVTVTAPGPQPVLLTADPGLPDTPGTASGYRLVSAGISPAQVAGVLGSVFGVAGTPVDENGSWVVGPADGARLVVSADPLVSWSFVDPVATTQPAVGPPMPADKAIELTTALLGSIGVDTAAIDWQVDRYSGMTEVTAWQLVAGARTRLAWAVGFDPSGAVVQASGFSAGLEEVPGYPVVGAATAVQRSGQPGWSAIGPALIPGPAPDPAASPQASTSSSSSPSASPDRPAMTVPVTNVTATGATLGLAQYWQSDGSILFLPAYVLDGADGTRWTLLAVDEPYVQFVDRPYPTAAPAVP